MAHYNTPCINNYARMTWSILDPQHDEVEPNLKKILHTNGKWGLEATSM